MELKFIQPYPQLEKMCFSKISINDTKNNLIAMHIKYLKTILK